MSVSKERDQLEDYLTRMLAERDAMIPAMAEDYTGGGGGGGGLSAGMEGFIGSMGGRPGKGFDL